MIQNKGLFMQTIKISSEREYIGHVLVYGWSLKQCDDIVLSLQNKDTRFFLNEFPVGKYGIAFDITSHDVDNIWIICIEQWEYALLLEQKKDLNVITEVCRVGDL